MVSWILLHDCKTALRKKFRNFTGCRMFLLVQLCFFDVAVKTTIVGYCMYEKTCLSISNIIINYRVWYSGVIKSRRFDSSIEILIITTAQPVWHRRGNLKLLMQEKILVDSSCVCVCVCVREREREARGNNCHNTIFRTLVVIRGITEHFLMFIFVFCSTVIISVTGVTQVVT